MVIENLEGNRRRQVLALWALLFLAQQVNAIGLSRNPLFTGITNRRHAIPATTVHNLHHQQQKHFQHYQKQFLQTQDPIASASSNVATTYNTGENFDPYVSGSNSLEKGIVENLEPAAALGTTAPDTLASQSASNLAVAASSSSYSSSAGSGGGYGGGSSAGSYDGAGGYGGGAGSAGSYGGGAGSGGSYGGGSGGLAGGSYGSGSSGSGGGYGGDSGGGYGLGTGGSYGDIGGSSYGGGAGSYGAGSFGGSPSYSVSYPPQQNTKADTIHLLSSLAPSLLLSSLLLPLALALLTNATGTLTGRKKRDVFSRIDDGYVEDDVDLSFIDDGLDSEITLSDAHFFPTMDAMLESYSPGDTERLSEFIRRRGLISDTANTCLEKLACFGSTTKGKFKRSDKLKKAMKLLGQTTDQDIRKRFKVGSSIGTKNENDCLTKFVCKEMKSS